MSAAYRPQRPGLPRNIFFAILPGPTRKRSASPYCYRLTYESQEPLVPGCAMMWEVYGGRTTYQVALERDVSGELRWHCTCADHVYRGEQDEPHVCKHVRAIVEHGRPKPPACAEEAQSEAETAQCAGV